MAKKKVPVQKQWTKSEAASARIIIFMTHYKGKVKVASKPTKCRVIDLTRRELNVLQKIVTKYGF
jgi:hypothetical protein